MILWRCSGILTCFNISVCYGTQLTYVAHFCQIMGAQELTSKGKKQMIKLDFSKGNGLLPAITQDYETGKIEVGLPVKMVFRIRNFDKPRGFVQYYWKAKPILNGQEA